MPEFAKNMCLRSARTTYDTSNQLIFARIQLANTPRILAMPGEKVFRRSTFQEAAHYDATGV
jgi:hypothetical protein